MIVALEVHPDEVQLMAELAVQSRFDSANDEDDLIEQKRVATGKHRRALKNNLILFQSGEIDQAEYYRIICDPEAAHVVFSSSLPITVVPLDLTTQVRN